MVSLDGIYDQLQPRKDMDLDELQQCHSIAQVDNGTENSSQAVISATAVAASLIQNKR